MKKITDKDVEALKAGKKVTKGFIQWHGKFPKEKATEEQLKHVGYKNLIR